jgi:hypothetical protein
VSTSAKSSVGRVAVTVLMDVIVVVAVAALTHLVISFFGSMSGSSWGAGLLALTRYVVVPIGIEPLVTPYGGLFLVDAAGTVLGLLGVEWVLGLVRRNV